MLKIAIVEDLTPLREGFVSLIEAAAPDFVCVGAYENGTEALGKLPFSKPDIVLMDIHLPDISGIDCIRRLRSEGETMQFVMCTVYEDDDNIFNALAAGATGYLLKNTAPHKILDALSEVADGGSPMSSQIARRVVASFRTAPAAPAPDTRLSTLSKREAEVLEWLARGFMYKEVGAELGISTETVRRHCHNIYEKLHVQTRTEAINKLYGK